MKIHCICAAIPLQLLKIILVGTSQRMMGLAAWPFSGVTCRCLKTTPAYLYSAKKLR